MSLGKSWLLRACVCVALGVGVLGLWQVRSAGDPRVEVNLESVCANPHIEAKGQTWETRGNHPRSWDGLDSMSGVLQIEGDKAIFLADDGNKMFYTAAGQFSSGNCNIQG